MKKNCNGCKAFDNSFNRCDLGHPIAPLKELWGVVVQYKPTAECEKPRTYGDLSDLLIAERKAAKLKQKP